MESLAGGPWGAKGGPHATRYLVTVKRCETYQKHVGPVRFPLRTISVSLTGPDFKV